MRLLLIANPVAGGGRAARAADDLARRLAARGHAVEVHRTAGPGDAGLRAQKSLDGVDVLVSVGGDGTLNEIVNGLADPSATPLVPFAFGTGNMLARELGLPWKVEPLIRVIEAGHVRRIDLGHANERCFLAVVSAGFDAEVTRHVGLHRRGALGFLGYARPILRALRGYVPPTIRLCVDGGPPRECALVIVTSLRNYGGLFTVADHARCDSGTLEVCTLERAKFRHLVRAAAGGKLHRAGRWGGFAYETATRVQIDAPSAVAVEIDGDYAGTTPVEIFVERAVVPICVPASASPA